MRITFSGLLSKVRERGSRGQLLRGGVGSVVMSAAGTLLSLAMVIVLARNLGAKGYGIYTYIFTLVSLLAVPARFGLPNLVVRETANAEASQQWGLMRGVWRWAGTGAAVLSVLLALISGALAWLFADRFSPLQLMTFAWGLAFIPMLVLASLRGAALRGLRKALKGQLPGTIIRPALLIGLIFVFGIYSQSPLGPDKAMALHVLATAIAFIIGAWMLQRERPKALAEKPRPQYESQRWLKAVLPFALIDGMTVIDTQIDVLMLGILGTAESVGVYKVASRGAAVAIIGLTAINMVIAPYFARFHTKQEKKKLRKLAVLGSRASFLLALPVAIVFIFFGTEILRFVFGEEYIVGHMSLSILVCAYLVRAASGSLGLLLNMTGHEGDSLKVAMLGVACNIILNAAMIPLWGIDGAATATAITILLKRLVLWRIVYHRLGLDGSIMGRP